MRDRDPIQTVAALVGIGFLVIGILGFVPGVTSNYDELKFAGHTSDAQLFGIFDTSVLHNIVYLLFGIVGIALARSTDGARTYLVGGGLVYLVLFVYGAIWHGETGSNWIPVNWPDNLLHLALGVGMVTAGVLLSRGVVRRTAPAV
jgi:hypothetical protein